MTTLPPWSYSMLDKFENCPRSAFNKYVLKMKEPSSPEIERGNRIHKAFEDYIKSEAPASPCQREIAPWQDILRTIDTAISRGATPTAEWKLGVTRGLEPCSFFDKDVWGRGAADITLLSPNKTVAWCGDYKTGKVREKELQLRILAMMLFRAVPTLDRVTACNIWLASDKIGEPYVFRRALEHTYWGDILPRIKKMEDSLVLTMPEGKPSGLCRFCPDTKCPFNKLGR